MMKQHEDTCTKLTCNLNRCGAQENFVNIKRSQLMFHLPIEAEWIVLQNPGTISMLINYFPA